MIGWTTARRTLPAPPMVTVPPLDAIPFAKVSVCVPSSLTVNVAPSSVAVGVSAAAVDSFAVRDLPCRAPDGSPILTDVAP